MGLAQAADPGGALGDPVDGVVVDTNGEPLRARWPILSHHHILFSALFKDKILYFRLQHFFSLSYLSLFFSRVRKGKV